MKTIYKSSACRSVFAFLLTAGIAWSAYMVAPGQTRDEATEEFHKTYPLSAGGRLSLNNINGAVQISTWDRNEVKVDAVKRAYKREFLAEMEIVVDAGPDSIQINTRYLHDNLTFSSDSEGRYNKPGTVEYTLVVPATVRLDPVDLINGSLDIRGVSGTVRASSINGRVKARELIGETKLSTINGLLDAAFDRLDESKPISLMSVNGSVSLTLPSDTNAVLDANTVSGGIKNDFGLRVRDGDYVGHHLAGTVGRGGAHIKIGNVSGGIEIHRAQDGKPLNPATDAFSAHVSSGEAGETVISREESLEIANAARAAAGAGIDIEIITREAQRVAAKAIRDSQRAQAEALREVEQSQRDIERETRDIERSQRIEHGGRSNRVTDRQSKSFATTGVPSVNLGTFDGAIAIHGWEKSEVMFTAVRSASSDKEMSGINLRAEQHGDEVSIIAEFDKTFAVHLHGSNASVALDVYLPRNSNLRAASGDGALTLDGISGELDLHTGDGAINAHNAQGRILANTGDGSVRLIGFNGEANVRTGDGAISLDGSFVQLSAETGDGSIALGLPGDANVTIETNAGAVSGRGLAVAEEASTGKGMRRWRIGSGGTVFTLKTGDGNVVVRSSSGPGNAPRVQ